MTTPIRISISIFCRPFFIHLFTESPFPFEIAQAIFLANNVCFLHNACVNKQTNKSPDKWKHQNQCHILFSIYFILQLSIPKFSDARQTLIWHRILVALQWRISMVKRERHSRNKWKISKSIECKRKYVWHMSTNWSIICMIEALESVKSTSLEWS